jgi:hypothetical protein
MMLDLQEFVTYDIALKLKKLGYSTPLTTYYNIYNKHVFFSNNGIHNEAIWAPNYKQTLDWLTIVFGLKIKPTKEYIIKAVNELSEKL